MDGKVKATKGEFSGVFPLNRPSPAWGQGAKWAPLSRENWHCYKRKT